MTVQHELQCTHGDSVSNWIFYTQAIFRRLEHRKPSAKMRLCLKDNKPCLVSSGHFLRTARLVRTRHLVHVSNGRYDLAPNPRRLQSSPSTGPSQPRTPSSAAVQRRALKKRVSNPCQSCYFLSVPMVTTGPLRRGLHSSEQHALSPQSNLGYCWGVTGRWQSTVVLRLKAKEN